MLQMLLILLNIFPENHIRENRGESVISCQQNFELNSAIAFKILSKNIKLANFSKYFSYAKYLYQIFYKYYSYTIEKSQYQNFEDKIQKKTQNIHFSIRISRQSILTWSNPIPKK